MSCVFLITFYGIEVCPFLERLSVLELAGEIAVAFALVFYVKLKVYRRGCRLDDGRPVLVKPWVALRSEFGA